MAQLVFRYATMGAGKSIEVLKVAHNYEEGGKQALLLTSSVDNRYGTGYISSRIGIKREAICISKDDDITIILDVFLRGHNVRCIIIDEVQFFSEKHIQQLRKIVDYQNIPVICYGLKNDFQNNLFVGSHALLRYADKIEEVKTICRLCERKATMVLRVENGLPVYIGEQIKIGGNESYVPVCSKCYHSPDLDELRKSIK